MAAQSEMGRLFEGERHKKVLQEAGPGRLVVAREYVTFMEYLDALEEDTKVNAHSTSIAHTRAQ